MTASEIAEKYPMFLNLKGSLSFTINSDYLEGIVTMDEEGLEDMLKGAMYFISTPSSDIPYNGLALRMPVINDLPDDMDGYIRMPDAYPNCGEAMFIHKDSAYIEIEYNMMIYQRSRNMDGKRLYATRVRATPVIDSKPIILIPIDEDYIKRTIKWEL